MITKTLAQLIDDTQFRCNFLGAQPIGATPARITGLLNERKQELYDLILSVDNSYYIRKYTFSLPDPVLQALFTVQALGTAPPNVSAARHAPVPARAQGPKARMAATACVNGITAGAKRV